jgi:hypothetical protein
MTSLRALVLNFLLIIVLSNHTFLIACSSYPLQQSMVSTRHKPVVSSNPLPSGRAYKALIGKRKQRQIARRKLEAWNKSNGSTRSSSNPPLSPSVMEASNWTTPPPSSDSSSPNTTPLDQTDQIAGWLRRRAGNPTCLDFSSRQEILYPNHHF